MTVVEAEAWVEYYWSDSYNGSHFNVAVVEAAIFCDCSNGGPLFSVVEAAMWVEFFSKGRH